MAFYFEYQKVSRDPHKGTGFGLPFSWWSPALMEAFYYLQWPRFLETCAYKADFSLFLLPGATFLPVKKKNFNMRRSSRLKMSELWKTSDWTFIKKFGLNRTSSVWTAWGSSSQWTKLFQKFRSNQSFDGFGWLIFTKDVKIGFADCGLDMVCSDSLTSTYWTLCLCLAVVTQSDCCSTLWEAPISIRYQSKAFQEQQPKRD